MTEKRADHSVLVGTSGFSFEDWVGPVYPEGMKKTDWLGYYERELGFPTLEVNYTYYAMPQAKTLAAMSAKTTDDFQFVVKAHKSMTHELWIDKKRTERIDNTEVFPRFVEALSPLLDAGKLSAVLAQFPYFFYRNRDNAEYIRDFRERLGDLPVVIEFRNQQWHDEKTMEYLADQNLGYCVVDEPRLKGLMPFHPAATTDLAYFRFHGRNTNWFRAPMEVRYDYLYSADELTELLEGIMAVSGDAKKTLAFFNNCHAGQAAKNALEMVTMLQERLERDAGGGDVTSG